MIGKSFKRKKEEIIAFVLGGIAPDIDIFLLWINYIYPNFFLLTHRGITHSLFFGFFAGMIVLKLSSFEKIRNKIQKYFDFRPIISKRTIAFAYAGVLIHLFLDYITTRGIPLLYPLTTQKYSAEIFFYTDIYLTVLSLITVIYLYKKPGQTNNAPKFLIIFLIVAAGLGAFRISEKTSAEKYFHNTGIRTYPTMDSSDWYAVREDNNRIEIYEYDPGTSPYNTTIQRLNIVPDGEKPDAALLAAGLLPQVKMFKWRAYTVAINAEFKNGTWALEYYDPLQRSMFRDISGTFRGFSRSFGSLNVTVIGNDAVVS
ncbi:MAG: metal-dependent hydrolase [Candidatus Methanoperedens sp.]|nr:metal-dependent hydrolase [Candidatus Methanoperedens sp.]